MIELKFEGLDRLNHALSKAAGQIPREKLRFLAQEAQLVSGRAKIKTPVDTGRLRAAWQSTEPTGEEIEVYNNTEYAAHVEFGHRQFVFGRDTGKIRQGEHMLRDAIDESVDNFQRDARQILARIFK